MVSERRARPASAGGTRDTRAGVRAFLAAFRLATLGLALAGCSGDTLHRIDGVTPAAGDAQARNAAIHAVEPRAGDDSTPEPGSDGVRAVRLVAAYRYGGLPVPVSSQPASPDDGGG